MYHFCGVTFPFLAENAASPELIGRRRSSCFPSVFIRPSGTILAHTKEDIYQARILVAQHHRVRRVSDSELESFAV